MAFEPTGLGLEVFQKRYAIHENESWGEACNRVVAHVAAAEQQPGWRGNRDLFNDVILPNKFMPGGRIWYGSGRPRGGLLNCFVIGSPDMDSREGWGKTVSDMLVISGTGGGVGINCSPVRPRGSKINGAGGEATGAVSLMEIINATGQVLKAGGGRRTALMLCLDLQHGDILEFLDKKLDLQQLNNANVSVCFQDDPEIFFALVKEDGDLELTFRGKVVNRVKARVIWDKIITNALKCGEPGLLNMHLANRMSNIWYHRPITSTNPCQPGWATVLTPNGIKTFDDIAVGSIIWSGKRWTKVVNKAATGVKPVYAYKTNAGIFYGTENHRVVEHGDKIEATNAKAIDVALGPFSSVAGAHDPKDVMDGLVLGDGTEHKASRAIFLCVGQKDGDYFREPGLHALIRYKQPSINPTAYRVRTSFTELPRTFERWVPDRFKNFEHGPGFLRGLYSANGSVVENRVTLKAASLRLIRDVQEMLSAFGILSYITTNKTHDVEFSNGLYTCKESYDLNIGTLESRRAFKTLIGFIQHDKQARLDETLEGHGGRTKITYDIVERELISEEPVYDITVEADEHTYWTGGLLVSNCGEIPLENQGVCCLGAVVLPRFIRNGTLDWNDLEHTVSLGVRFLDDVLSVNAYPLQEIAEEAKAVRRIGLGVMGLHDMLLELGYKYTSPKGLEFVDKVFKFIKNAAYYASIMLAVEKGPFPKFDRDKYLKSNFVKTLKPTLRSLISQYGIRNCALLTIAPTGTTSLVSGVSSGIEPVFGAAYNRTWRNGDALQTDVMVHPLFKRMVNEGRDVSHFEGVYDLTLRDHFEMQRVCQKHVDNAISKTINVMPGTSPQALSDLYMEFMPELKGITVYPEGSRENQPLTPIPLDEAMRLVTADTNTDINVTDKCRSGVCDI